MNTFWTRSLLLATLCLIILGCGSGVSREDYDNVSKDLAQAKIEAERTAQKLELAMKKATELARGRDDMRAALADCQQKLNQQTGRSGASVADIQEARAEAKRLETELADTKAEVAKQNSDLVVAKDRIRNLEASLKRAEGHLAPAQKKTDQMREILATTKKQLEAKQKQLEEARQQLKARAEKGQENEARETSVDQKAPESSDRIASLKKQLDEEKTHNTKLNKDLDVSTKQIKKLIESFDDKEEVIRVLESRTRKLTDEFLRQQDKLEYLRRRFAQGRVQAELINGLFVPILTGQFDQMSGPETVQVFLKWRDEVNASGSKVLVERFQSLVQSDFADAQVMELFFAVADLLPRTLSLPPPLLEDKLPSQEAEKPESAQGHEGQ